MLDWSIEAVSFGNCNRDYGCPCQFEQRATRGNCRGFEVGRIKSGHFGGVTLDDLCYVLLYAWPGAVYEGNGMMQAVIDERANEEQTRGEHDGALWRGDRGGEEPLVGLSRHVDDCPRADLQAD